MGLRVRLEGMREAREMYGRVEDIENEMDRFLLNFAYGTLVNIIRLAPVDIGFLRSMITLSRGGDKIVFVSSAEYSRYQEFGIGMEGAMSFESIMPEAEEGIAFATYVHGFAGQPYMRPGVRKGLDTLEDKLDDMFRDL